MVPSGWTRIQGAAPQKGDILVYLGNDSNPYGHVAIYEADRVTYHQNVNGPFVERLTYRYDGFSNPYWGVVRPSFSGGSSPLNTGWETRCSYTDDHNAVIGATISTDRSVQFTNAGAYVWDPDGNLVAQASEGTSVSGYYMNINYNIVGEMGISLQAGTTYTYQFWAMTEGNTYYSDKKTFNTAGDTPISTITLSESSRTLNPGESFINSATVSPSYATNKNIIWSSSDYSVAAVDNGMITAVGAGSATITAQSYDGKTASCVVTVKEREVAVDSLSLSVTSKTITEGDSFINSVSIYPENASNKSIIWNSSDTSVVQVNNSGIITGISEGTAIVTAKSSNGKSASCVVNVVWNSPFDDVTEGSWYFDTVKYVYKQKLMTGLNSNQFGPADNLSRAQFAVILYRMNGEPDVEYKDVFPDVVPGTWFTNAVLWANSTNIIQGYTYNHQFGPADEITREQVAVIMYRYARYKGYDTSQSVSYDNYKDGGSVSGFAKDAMSWAVGCGIISGRESGTCLDPQGGASRADCATIIMRFCEKYE